MQKQEFGHIYPVVLTSRLVSNAYLKGIMMKIKIVVTP